MKFTGRACFLILAASALIASTAVAQMGRRHLYNPATEATLKGEVSKVSTVTGRGGWNGIHLMLQSEGHSWDVHVGPAAYVTQNGFSFAAGDQIEVVGSKARFNGEDALIARQITRQGKVLTLRDSQGYPRWSRARWTTQ